jgi:pyruvate dehydrogenase E1 component beta subunit
LKVVAPSTPKDAKGLLKSAIREDNPVIFIEAQLLYPLVGEVPDGEYTVPIGSAEVKREGSDLTIIAWSKMVHFSLEAAGALSKEGVEAEVIDLRTLRPLDLPLILESVRKTGRAVIVEEGWPFAGVGAEIAYQIHHEAMDSLDAPVERVTSEDVPVAYAKNLEKASIPDPPKIIKAAKKVLYME